MKKINLSYTILFFLLIVFLLLLILFSIFNSKSILLFQASHAKWIKPNIEFNLGVRRDSNCVAIYKKTFFSDSLQKHIIVDIQALRTFKLIVNNKVVFSRKSRDLWKKTEHVNIGPYLRKGENLIIVAVGNSYGHPMLKIGCPRLRIYSDKDWWCSVDEGKTWALAKQADDRSCLSVFKKRFNLYNSLKSTFWVYALLTIIAFTFLKTMNFYKTLFAHLSVRSIISIIMILWCIMALNNIFKIPLFYGMDSNAHYEYICYVAKNNSLPAYNYGWQTFQTPLYHIVSGLFLKILRLVIDTSLIYYLLRLLPLFCGLMQIELCYRAVRIIFPAEKDLQILAGIFGVAFPISIYISQVVGNESFVMLVGGMALLALLRVLKILRKVRFLLQEL